MQNNFKNTTNAEWLAKHRNGVAPRIKRIEVAVEELRDAMQYVFTELQRAQEGEQRN